jgi:hypothetical protein
MLIDDKVRIHALIRAMQDVVIPSIAPESQLALEQAHLVCRHLGLMLDLSDYNYRLQLAELAHFARMLQDLIACLAPEEGSSELAAARDLLQQAEPIARLTVPDCGELSRLTHRVRESVDEILEKALALGAATRTRASHIVIDYAERQILRERVAAKTSGFDLDAASQPDLKDVT